LRSNCGFSGYTVPALNKLAIILSRQILLKAVKMKAAIFGLNFAEWLLPFLFAVTIETINSFKSFVFVLVPVSSYLRLTNS
jgi:hypothetical protein